MALNPSIPLAGQQIDTANPLQALSAGMYQKQRDDQVIARQQQQDVRQEKLDDSALKSKGLEDALTQEKILKAHYDGLEDREKSRIRNVAIAAAQVKPLLDRGDTEGALKFARDRQAQLHARMGAGENIDDADTAGFIDMLEKGDIEGAKQIADTMVHVGYMTEAIKPKVSGGGGTGDLVANLMSENPKLTYADALYQVQTGNRKDQRMENGHVQNLPGAADAKKNLSSADAQGKKEGETIAIAKADLPKVVDNANYAIQVIDGAINSPGIAANFGLEGLVPNRPGGNAADAQAFLDQIEGGAFLSAYSTLRGGGAITEIEGQKATAAIIRMKTAQSFEAFKRAAEEYKTIIAQGVERAKNLASGDTFNQPSAGGAGGGARTVIKTQTSPSTGKKRIIYSDGTEEIQ